MLNFVDKIRWIIIPLWLVGACVLRFVLTPMVQDPPFGGFAWFFMQVITTCYGFGLINMFAYLLQNSQGISKEKRISNAGFLICGWILLIVATAYTIQCIYSPMDF